MNYAKVLMALLFLTSTCQGINKKSHHVLLQGLDGAVADADLTSDATVWRNWKPWKILKWEFTKENNTQNLDERLENDTLSTNRWPSTAQLTSDTSPNFNTRPAGSVRKELVTMMFNSMLQCVVKSWDVIQQKTDETNTPYVEPPRTASELTLTSKKRKSVLLKPLKTRRSESKIKVGTIQTDPMQKVWFSSPDEKAVICFHNGNIYEGDISMKCMHGEGRYQWADGTVYLGKFKNNEISGRGIIQWKDDTWYEGEFAANLRHGRGLYVDSRKQRSYAGGWHNGTKHGEGVIYYSKTFQNSYDGQWNHNVRHGYGSREYCAISGYKGEWDRYIREGKGLMIWPNHDFYRGDWKNGVMSDYGMYIWDAYYNNSMSFPSVNAFRGNWEKGQRNGYGVLNLGTGLGSYYKGDFKNNKKHGAGKIVTNNGHIIQDKRLFVDDNFRLMVPAGNKIPSHCDHKNSQTVECYQFNICDETVGLKYHIEQALQNIDKEKEIRANIITEYIERNQDIEKDLSYFAQKENAPEPSSEPSIKIEDIIEFEQISLQKALKCYETDLRSIYYMYAKICNTFEINFKPILIRLYLWQLFYDCNIYENGLTLVDIDRMFQKNPAWLARYAHNPFEKIYFWQYIHILIAIAIKLYAKRQLPDTKPDTIVAKAFRTFMEKNVLIGVRHHKGRLINGYGSFIPLKALYRLYCNLGEPHTIRKFLCATRNPPHLYVEQPPEKQPDDNIPLGRNAYVFGDDMSFVADDYLLNENEDVEQEDTDLMLFKFGNLSSKTILNIFASIFPQLYQQNKIMNLDIELTFYEFFEAFMACTEESIRLMNEELAGLEKLTSSMEQLLNGPVGVAKTTK